jgi:hypothetical protein
MLYHFYGNTTDLYTKILERTPVLYSKGQLSMKSLYKLFMVVTDMWQSYTRWPRKAQFHGDIPIKISWQKRVAPTKSAFEMFVLPIQKKAICEGHNCRRQQRCEI